MPPKSGKLSKKERKLTQAFNRTHSTIPSHSSKGNWTSISGSKGAAASVEVTPVNSSVPSPTRPHKKAKVDHVNEDEAQQAAPDSGEEASVASARPSKPYGVSQFMGQFMSKFKYLLDSLFATEADASTGSQCDCGRLTRTTRCTDCLQSPVYCDLCFVDYHRKTPLHWAERWNGNFFERMDISSLHHVLTLGHNGNDCPCVDYTDPQIVKFTLSDVNGIHSTKIVFCACAGAGDHTQQLLRARIFPASTIQPTTGFTFNLLEMFHLDCLESKKSAYDYIHALRRRTNNAFPETVPNPYKQFLIVMRVWRALAAEKSSGQAHGIDKHFPDRPVGSIVVPCFACPEEGFNTGTDNPNDYNLEDLEDVQHALTLFLSADGHFGLVQKNKNNDPDDISLLEGKGIFPPEGPYQEYVKKAGESTEKCTCAKLNAANAQNKQKFRNCRCSGIVAVNCARHCVFRHGAVADLQKGERYANTDHALAGALKCAQKTPFIVLTYDIACQYSIKLKERFTTTFPSLAHLIDRIRLFVPKLHIQGHKDDCQYRWSLNFSKWVGRVDGERIEPGWGEAKQAGGMTKEMNTGHRHDTLTDFQNDWNWRKVQLLTESLRKHLESARKRAAQTLDHYIGLSLLNGKERIEKWFLLPTEARKVKGEWESVFRYKEQKMPTQSSVYCNLLSKEVGDSDDQPGAVSKKARSTVVFLNTGLKIESKQQSLTSKINEEKKILWDESRYQPSVEIEKARINLKKMIKQWRADQTVIMEGISDHLEKTTSSSFPETDKLFLPSAFLASERKKYGIEKLAAEELELRKGQANDAIRNVRSYVKYTSSLVTQKNLPSNAIHGQDLNTRAGQEIQRAHSKKRGYMEKYRTAREAMIQLGMAPDDESYPPLRDEDIWMKDPTRYHSLGDGKKSEGWIWRTRMTSNLTEQEQDNYSEDFDRVQWFRAYADMQRWQEEVEILTEEFRRAIRGFDTMVNAWTSLTEEIQVQTPENIGQIAYGHKKIWMFSQMARECREAFQELGGTWPQPGVSLADHIRSERPSQSINWPAKAL